MEWCDMKSTKCLIIIIATFFLLTACGLDGAESGAKDTFDEWAQHQVTPYKNVRYKTLETDGAFATVRITADFKQNEKAEWVEMETILKLRNMGGEWVSQTYSYQLSFRVTHEWLRKWLGSLAETMVVCATTFEGNEKLYTMKADGSQPKVLIENGRYPDFSPDGSSIVFSKIANDNSSMDIYTINIAGGSPQQVATGHNFLADPSWSPDGTRIAFINSQGALGEKGNIYVVNIDGSNPVNLTKNSTLTRFWSLVWSPFGIIFTSDSPPSVYIMNDDGTDMRPVGLQTYKIFDVSSDGTKLLGNSIIADIGINGVVSNVIENAANGDVSAAWSPDGTRILNGNGNPFLTDLEGINIISMPNDTPLCYEVTWSPVP